MRLLSIIVYCSIFPSRLQKFFRLFFFFFFLYLLFFRLFFSDSAWPPERKLPFKGIRLSRLCNRAFYTRSITGTPLSPFNSKKKYLEPMFFVFSIFNRNFCNIKYFCWTEIFHFRISFEMLLQKQNKHTNMFHFIG